MVDIDAQQKKILSYLNPDNVKLDDRNLIDRIAFMANFAKLITFYNEENQPDGNWQKVLLKDPIFLLAYIARTPKSQLAHELTLNKNVTTENITKKDINKIFAHLLIIIPLIDSWIEYLKLTNETYPFRDYVLHAVENHIGLALFKLYILNTSLKKNENTYEKESLVTFDLQSFQGINNQVAKVNNSNAKLFESHITSSFQPHDNVAKLYKQVITFVNNVVDLAEVEFHKHCKRKSNFSDTSLLISIIKLMQYAQSDLNSFTQKHLDFYYKRILQQQKKTAEPDSVFLLVEPSNQVEGVTLPQGFAFSAGVYEDNSPIDFVTQEITSVNHIKIGQIINGFTNDKQYFSHLTNNKINIDESGKQITNKWFGKSTDNRPTEQGFILASPMFALASGQRVVILILELDKACTLNIEKLELSTEKKWITIPKTDLEKDIVENCYAYERKNTLYGIEHSITITLNQNFTPIATFNQELAKAEENAPNYLNYPCCKITLAQSPTESPPRLLALQIEINVENSESVTLNNDLGPLIKKPMNIFGVIPEQGSVCHLKCNEAFSKPLTKELTLNFNWASDLPESLYTYYEAYNDYYHHEPKKKRKEQAYMHAKQTSHGALNEKKLDKKKKLTINNSSFRINIAPSYMQNEATIAEPFYADFQLFHQKNIKHSKLPKKPFFSRLIGLIKGFIFAKKHPHDLANDKVKNKLTSQYTISNEEVNKLVGSSGLDIRLSEPSIGFGNSIYAQVVTHITLYNSIKKPDKHKKLPNVPYVPKVTNATISYDAIQHIYFYGENCCNCLTQDFALIHFGVFTPYCYYYQTRDSDKALIDLSKTVFVPKETNVESDTKRDKQGTSSQQGLSLYQGVNNHCVYINLTNVIPSSELNILIGISATILREETPIEFFYWSNQGWKTLSLLNDQTHNLTVSGIITVFLPSDIAIDPVQFSHRENANQNSWLLLRQTNNVREVNVIGCETQAIKVHRQKPIKLPLGVKPLLKAGSINAPNIENKHIVRIVQPFDSFGGVASECEDDFQKRVSQQIKTKNRAISHWDYVTLVKQACQDLFFASVLTQEDNSDLGQVCVGIIKQYQSINQSGALRPAFSNMDLLAIKEYIDERKSSAVSFSVKNIPYQTVKVIVNIKKNQHAFESSITPLLNETITCYLSPWIKSQQLQYKISQGVKKSELIGLISNIEGIDYVMNVQVVLEKVKNQNHTIEFQDTFLPEKNYLLVSSLDHDFQFHDGF